MPGPWIPRDERDVNEAAAVTLQISVTARLISEDGTVAELTIDSDPDYIDPTVHLSSDVDAHLQRHLVADIAEALDNIAQRAAWGRDGVAP